MFIIRWLFRLAIAVSLILCVGSVALWVRSYYRWDRWDSGTVPRVYVLHARGRAILQWDRELGSRAQRSDISGVNLGAIRYESRSYVREAPYFRELMIRYWILPPIFLILPALGGFFRWRRRRKTRRAGLCQTCGYDLRAHRPGQNCPECGTTVPACDSRRNPG
jgi:hypothetical protein